MAGITDMVFRSIMRELGCGVVVTELVSADGIEHRSQKTLQLMRFEELQRPVGIQLFGDDPEMLGRAAKLVEEMGADFVDLNFGCPVPKVTKRGAGSATLRDLTQVTAVFRAVKGATKLPVTVKIRTGWDEGSRNSVEVCKIAHDEGLTWVAIHGRTRAQGYSGDADWDYISDVKAKSQIPILGNGDIHTARQAVDRLRSSGCDGVLIGRGCLKNPWIFQQSMALLRQSSPGAKAPAVAAPLLGLEGGSTRAGQEQLDGAKRSTSVAGRPDDEQAPSPSDFQALFLRMRQKFEDCQTEPRFIALQIKKFAAWYSTGYAGASQFRREIFQECDVDGALAKTIGFFEGLKEASQADTSHEPFLMGGHG
jgi:nifR3 family TIM-barrel protein